jgi:hypothetical protein
MVKSVAKYSTTKTVPKKDKKSADRPVVVSVEWGYDLHECPMSMLTWNRILKGHKVIRREPFWYEGERFTGEWHFNHSTYGSLLVTYDDAGVGFDGALGDVYILVGKDVMNWTELPKAWPSSTSRMASEWKSRR